MPVKEESGSTQDMLESWEFFPSVVYRIKKPEFIDMATEVSNEYLDELEEKTTHRPFIYQTKNLDDPRLYNLSLYIADTAYNILESQGYDMTNKVTHYSSMWVQEIEPDAYMAQHIHTDQSQISGFYFLKCEENSSKISLYDPRPGKVQISLNEKDLEQATVASVAVNITPEPGLMVFFNSWLPHGFTENGSGKNIRFIHFNLKVVDQIKNDAPTITLTPIIV